MNTYGISNIKLELGQRKHKDDYFVAQVGMFICLTAVAIMAYTMFADYSDRQVERTVETLQALQNAQ